MEVTGSDSGITYEKRLAQDPEVRYADPTKSRQEGEWEPDVPLREGIERTLPYFRDSVSE